MNRYKINDQHVGKFLCIVYEEQLIEGSFSHTLNELIDHVLDLSAFDQCYKNAQTGASAYDPRVLLKVILYAYSLGVTSPRRMEFLCQTHTTFIALSGDNQPHYTTLSSFIESLSESIEALFLEILLVCEQEELIGKEMVSIDGCKLSSNASKEWSGTKEELRKKAKKLKESIQQLTKRSSQGAEDNQALNERETRRLKTMKKKYHKIKGWLQENDDKIGYRGQAIKSNMTDNESAKMTTSHGILQGYDVMAAVDSKHQIILEAQAFGTGNEKHLLQPMIEGIKTNFQAIGKEASILQEMKLSADSGLHSEENLRYLEEEKIDSYVADPNFRKRDERFSERNRYKNKEERSRKRKFTPDEFIFNFDQKTCFFLAGKELWLKSENAVIKGKKGVQFMAHVADCRSCHLKKRCLRNEDQINPRQGVFFQGKADSSSDVIQRMKDKIDTKEGREQYSRRLGIVEPVFGNITSTLGLDRLSFRGQKKVNSQWKLFAIVHNIGKIQRYGKLGKSLVAA